MEYRISPDGQSLQARQGSLFSWGTIATRSGNGWTFTVSPTAEHMNALTQYAGTDTFGVPGRPGQFRASGGSFVPVTDSGQDLTTELAEEYKRLAEEARENNLSRYNQGLSYYDGMINRAQGYGQQRAQDIRRDYGNLAGEGTQNLVDRGLLTSTVAPTMQAGVQRQQDAALNRLSEEQSSYLNSIDQSRINFIAGREDVYPELDLYLNLMQGLGNYGSSVGALLGANAPQDIPQQNPVAQNPAPVAINASAPTASPYRQQATPGSRAVPGYRYGNQPSQPRIPSRRRF